MNESNYVQLLIDFMEAKAVMLEKLGYKKKLYFKEEDAKSLGRWKQERAKEVYYCIKLDIVSSRFSVPLNGLGSKTCPFCVDILNRFKYLCSSKCIYGMHHVRCTNKYSDFKTIQHQNNVATNNGTKHIATVLTNKWYKQLIKKLEKKHLKGE